MAPPCSETHEELAHKSTPEDPWLVGQQLVDQSVSEKT
jgi:hypothetical protein